MKSRGAAIENIYIHRFLRSIYEEPHDHPWFNCSVLLIGSYTEWLALPDADGERFVRVPGDVVLRDANLLHSISEVSANTVSLFITGKREREWGFRTVDGWVHWSKFPEWKNLAEGREVIKVRRPTAKEDGQDT